MNGKTTATPPQLVFPKEGEKNLRTLRFGLTLLTSRTNKGREGKIYPQYYSPKRCSQSGWNSKSGTLNEESWEHPPHPLILLWFSTKAAKSGTPKRPNLEHQNSNSGTPWNAMERPNFQKVDHQQKHE